MHKYLIAVFIVLSAYVSAEGQITNLELMSYKHTVTYSDYKAIFQLQAADLQSKSIEAAKYYYWYGSNQIKITQGGYSGKLLNGRYQSFYLDNCLKEQGLFESGLKVGEWKKWGAQGKLEERSHFKEGVLHGEFYSYNNLGDIFETGVYENGRRNGVWKTFINPDSSSITHYKHGIIYKPSENFFKRIFSKGSKPLTKL